MIVKSKVFNKEHVPRFLLATNTYLLHDASPVHLAPAGIWSVHPSLFHPGLLQAPPGDGVCMCMCVCVCVRVCVCVSVCVCVCL